MLGVDEDDVDDDTGAALRVGALLEDDFVASTGFSSGSGAQIQRGELHVQFDTFLAGGGGDATNVSSLVSAATAGFDVTTEEEKDEVGAAAFLLYIPARTFCSHSAQTRTGSFKPKCGSGIEPAEWSPQNVLPH